LPKLPKIAGIAKIENPKKSQGIADIAIIGNQKPLNTKNTKGHNGKAELYSR